MKRVALLAVALLAGPFLAVPTARAAGTAGTAEAAGNYVCFFGDRGQGGTPYSLSGNGCDGAGYVDVTVTVWSGSAAGTHRCRTVFAWNGYLSGDGCTAGTP